jgi:type I restriction enzyme S subunit
LNADQLLKYYDRVANASGAIPRLRRFIFDLAVRGALVAQHSSDEPISVTLTQIENNRVSESSLAAGEDKTWFAIPETWRWVRLGDIVDFSAGRTPSRNDPSFWNTGDYAWVSIADMRDGQVITTTKESISTKAQAQLFRSEPEPPGTIIMSFKLTIGKIARLGLAAFHNEAIISIKPLLAELDSYLFKVLPQFARAGQTKNAIKGATLNRRSISNILLPLPPLAEQHRIVAKVDELMTLCDDIEAARTKRESMRDRFAIATLARLNAADPNPAVLADRARFAIQSLDVLTTRPDQIKD